ncbi:Biphenyl 2,3-dioxygenase subunit beta [bacterium HR08]|nr:Biphenyl 2,3-dioxygenase subunit beta [bacterium HR08]
MISPELEREVVTFLLREAELLDEGRYQEWLALLTEDVRYIVPVQVTGEVETEQEVSMNHLDEDRASLELRIRRLETPYAWAERPRSRTRHFLSNIRVYPGERADEVLVRSNLLLVRSRGDDSQAEWISGERQDLLRRVNGEWRLARRVVVLDHSVVPVRSLSMLL